ncbi:MAG TPA: hypothetical protein ENJ46_02630, partial [Hellea balneolensis]|nr:hypothetical protein [Hellea balneolensis]
MRDVFFYPLLILVVAGIVFAAYWPSRTYDVPSVEDIRRDGYSVAKDTLPLLSAAPGTIIEFDTKPVQYAILSSNLPRDMVPPSAGVFATINPVYAHEFMGKRVKVSVRARKGRDNPLDVLQLAYFTAAAGDSAWHRFELGDAFSDFSFDYDVPTYTASDHVNYVGIWPGD